MQIINLGRHFVKWDKDNDIDPGFAALWSGNNLNWDNLLVSRRIVLIQPYSGHESRQSLEIYSKLSITDAQSEYESVIKKFPI